MATHTNIMTSDLGWVAELAKNEIDPEAANVFNSLSQLDPKQLIEESALSLLEDLRDLFNAYARAFNTFSENGASYSEAKIYGITNTPADFMIFRNNVKLVFANTVHGIINVSFNQHAPAGMTVDANARATSSSQEQSRDLIAQLGPFLDVSWTFQGEKVSIDRLAKFYFIEFVKASRAAKKDSSNQLLLKQIKALLQEKGLDL